MMVMMITVSENGWKFMSTNKNLLEIDMGIGGLPYGYGATRSPGLILYYLPDQTCII